MNQNINTQNKNILPLSSNSRPYRLLKRKGKPFWLNLIPTDNQIYQKYKTQPNSSTSNLQAENIYPSKPNPQQIGSKKQSQTSYLESIQSFNQNYQDDFNSYNSTINHDKKSLIKQLFSPKQIAQKLQACDTKVKKLQQNLIKTREGKSVDPSTIKNNPSKIFKKNKTFRTKTQESSTLNLTKQILFYENKNYLCKQNQKMVRIVQQMRRFLSILQKKYQQIREQTWEIQSLQAKVKKATSTSYELILQKGKSQVQLNQKQINDQIKILNSLKNKRKIILIKNDSSSYLDQERRLRQQLLSKKRLYYLREDQNLQLQKKINLYEDIIERLSNREKIQSYTQLERRKIFLEWDMERIKNHFDLSYVQEKLSNNQLKEQIQRIQSVILEKQNKLYDHQNNQQKSLKNNLENPEEENTYQKLLKIKQNIDNDNREKSDQLPVIQTAKKPKKQNYLLSRKRNQVFLQENQSFRRTGENSFFNKDLQKRFFDKNQQKQKDKNFCRQNNKQQIKFINNRGQREQSLREKKQQNNSNLNLNARIKRSSFKNTQINLDISELIQKKNLHLPRQKMN